MFKTLSFYFFVTRNERKGRLLGVSVPSCLHEQLKSSIYFKFLSCADWSPEQCFDVIRSTERHDSLEPLPFWTLSHFRRIPSQEERTEYL